MIKYSPDLGFYLTDYRSCDRCGINMQVSMLSTRRQCDDCIDFVIFEWHSFDWLFGRAVAA